MSVLRSLRQSGDLLSDLYADDVMGKLPASLTAKWIDSTKGHLEKRTLESFSKWLEDHTHTRDLSL